MYQIHDSLIDTSFVFSVCFFWFLLSFLCFLCFLFFSFFLVQAHFEESMAHSRKSVSEEELARYESFSTNMKSDRGFEEFSFEDKEGGGDGAGDADAAADDVDDLYG